MLSKPKSKAWLGWGAGVLEKEADEVTEDADEVTALATSTTMGKVKRITKLSHLKFKKSNQTSKRGGAGRE